jgi:hypothetical protein
MSSVLEQVIQVGFFDQLMAFFYLANNRMLFYAVVQEVRAQQW